MRYVVELRRSEGLPASSCGRAATSSHSFSVLLSAWDRYGGSSDVVHVVVVVVELKL